MNRRTTKGESGIAPQGHPFREKSPSSETPMSHLEEALPLQLLKAIESHDMARIRNLLSECPDPNFSSSPVRPLVYAAHLGQLDTVQLFAEKGANLHLTGKLPLFIMDKVVCFNEHGPSLTPLEAAERAGHEEVSGFLRKAISY